jgi:hypothetical protein
MVSARALKRSGLAGLLAAGIAVAGVGVNPGVAAATDGPFSWCPGQPMEPPTGPNRFGTDYRWDMKVCHTWFRVEYGYGNVPRFVAGNITLQGSSVWEGDNPPGDNPSGVNCGPGWCPVPPHFDPNFHG